MASFHLYIKKKKDTNKEDRVKGLNITETLIVCLEVSDFACVPMNSILGFPNDTVSLRAHCCIGWPGEIQNEALTASLLSDTDIP